MSNHEKLAALRYQFDKTLADLQQLLADIHTHGGKDVVVYREDGTSSEIYRERRD